MGRRPRAATLRNSKFDFRISSFCAVAILLFAGTISKAEDGYRLWLRYDPLPRQWIDVYRPRVTSVVAPRGSATLDAIREELVNGCTGLLNRPIPSASLVDRDGA